MVTDVPDYEGGMIMRGIYDSTYTTIALDADGYIIVPVKGLYEGTLTTLAVDSAGRIQAVLTDPEDVFGNPHYMGAAELAARFGSINTFDRRGETFWMDDFEDNINKWIQQTTGTGAAIALSTTQARNGAKSAELKTGNSAGNSAWISRWLPYRELGKLGIEAHITHGLGMRYWLIKLELYDGSKHYECHLRWDKPNNNLDIMGSAGSYTTIDSSFEPAAVDDLFHAVKLVGDFTTGKYVRLLFDADVYDLSSYDLFEEAVVYGKSVFCQIAFTTNDNNNRIGYVDDVILTQNES